MKKQITTVVFDLGGVLVKFHPAKALAQMGFSGEAQQVFLEKIFGGLWEECDGFQMSLEEIKELFKKRVPGYEAEVEILWDQLPLLTGVYDYSRSWVQSLKDRGLKLYVLSNFGQASFEKNSVLYDFLELMDGKLISYEVETTKPGRKIYELLMQRYQINPQEAVFIDDRQINVDGAAAAGMQGILFENYAQCSKALECLLGD